MNDKIHFAILGYGNIGKRYAEVIKELPQSQLCALIDTELQKEFSEVNAVDIYSSLSDFLNHDKHCDIIIVATPNGLHASHAEQCLKAGRHVLIEKPVAFKSNEVVDLINLAKENNVYLFPVWQIRYSPLIAGLKKLIDEGELGKIFWVQVDCFWNRGEKYYHNHPWHGTLSMDGGPLYTQFSHVIDLLLWLCGDLKVQDSSFYKIRGELQTQFEDSGVINFKLKDEGVALLSYTTSAPPGTSSNELNIITDKAKIQLSGKYFDKIELLQTEERSVKEIKKLGNSSSKVDIAKYCTIKLIEEVVQTLISNLNVDNSRDLQSATKIIEQVYLKRE